MAHFLPTFNAISGTTILSLSLSYSFIHSLTLSLIILPNTVCCKYFMHVLVKYVISFP